MTDNINIDVQQATDTIPECKSCVHVSRPVFVFGSNNSGRHGKGAALHAIKAHGAIYGEGWGRQGHSYGIPTKDEHLKPLKIQDIAVHVEWFKVYARLHEHEEFFLTRIGCGLAGFNDEDIAPLFKGSPKNVILPDEWLEILTAPGAAIEGCPQGTVPGDDDPEMWYC